MKKMSPEAQHAVETIRFALWCGEEDMTAGELRAAIRKLYGPIVDRELKDYFHPSIENLSANCQPER